MGMWPICLFLDAYFLNTKHMLLLRKHSPQVGGIDARASVPIGMRSIVFVYHSLENA